MAVSQQAQPSGRFRATHFGDYRLVKRIGIGGMGEVWIARWRGIEGFEKLVVLKRILLHLVSDPTFVEMFLNEARLAANLDHPNIVRIYDLGRAEDTYFISMEYLHGETLAAVMAAVERAGQRFPLEHALSVGLGLTAGLHHAHEQKGLDKKPLGIVHRDVSLSNVFLTLAGETKLLDFGIAKALHGSTVTGQTTIKGKVAYMSPEQATGAPVDRRSDVFAAGIVLYEITTMRRLFKGPNQFAILNDVAKAEIIPPGRLVPDYPPELERILLRALQRDPAARYQTAQELHLDLEEFASRLGLRTSPTGLAAWLRGLLGDRSYPALLDESEPGEATRPPPSAQADEVSASTIEPPKTRWLPWVVLGLAALGAGAWWWLASSNGAVDSPIAPSSEDSEQGPRDVEELPASRR